MQCQCPRCMVFGPGSRPAKTRAELERETGEALARLEFWRDDLDDTMTLARWRGDLASFRFEAAHG